MKGLLLSKSEYEKAMHDAETYESRINRYIANDASQTLPGQIKNFAARADDEQFQVAQYYQQALIIYAKFDKQAEGAKLLHSLLELVDTVTQGTVTFGIQLLLQLRYVEPVAQPPPTAPPASPSHKSEGKKIRNRPLKTPTSQKVLDITDWFEKFRPGTKKEVRERLIRLTQAKIQEHHLDFWLIRSAVLVARGLAVGDHAIEDDIDGFWCGILPLVAHYSVAIGNLGHAEQCYAEAGRVAQRLGNQEQAERFFQQASELNLISRSQPPAPGSIEDGLSDVLARTVGNIASEQFLPTPEQMKDEYAPFENKLERLLSDERLLLDAAAISDRAKKYENAGLLKWLPVADRDQFGNPRDIREGEDEIIRQLEKTYVIQVADIIGTLFSAWQKVGELTQAELVSHLVSSKLVGDYDWRIYREGLSRHFAGDYISSVHIFIPQFENILRSWAERESIAVKKLDARAAGIVWGQKLLDDLLNTRELKTYLGENLTTMMRWYLTINEPFGYRNKVAHGFIYADQCNFGLSALLIWLTLRVTDKSLPSESHDAQ